MPARATCPTPRASKDIHRCPAGACPCRSTVWRETAAPAGSAVPQSTRCRCSRWSSLRAHAHCRFLARPSGNGSRAPWISRRGSRWLASLAFSTGLASGQGGLMVSVRQGCRKRRAAKWLGICFEGQAIDRRYYFFARLDTSMKFGWERNSPKTNIKGLDMI